MIDFLHISDTLEVTSTQILHCNIIRNKIINMKII